jgi:hypothetical protein
VTLEFTDGDEVQNTVTFAPFALVVAPGAPAVPLLNSCALIALVAGMAIVASSFAR